MHIGMQPPLVHQAHILPEHIGSMLIERLRDLGHVLQRRRGEVVDDEAQDLGGQRFELLWGSEPDFRRCGMHAREGCACGVPGNHGSRRRAGKGTHTDTRRGPGLCFSDRQSLSSESAMGKMAVHKRVEQQ
jgi:hypothetical protein